jgi:branched-chain amino acid transport system ATP-binding protein
VLFNVSLRVQPGEVLALMGRNGMGKSTTIKTVCRLLPVNSGSIIFDTHDLSRLPTHKAAQLGIGLVPEGRRCFSNLSVSENLMVASRPGHWNLETVARLFPRLAERKSQSAAHLSGGEQQMLAIARALMTNPRLLILDEATEGLAPMVRQEIWRALATLNLQSGLAIIVVDKSISELSEVADHAVILEKGSSVWSGPMGELTEQISHRFLGI